MSSGDSHWRHTANEVKLWILDAKSFIPFPALLVIKSVIILCVGVIFLVFFFILSKKGLDFYNFLRLVRTKISGPVKEVAKIR